MRGSFIHNEVLLNPIEAHFRLRGAITIREFATKRGLGGGFIDLFIQDGKDRIACEAELSPDRVVNDWHKAMEVAATLLLIVVPTIRMARRARKQLGGLVTPYSGMWFSVLSLGPMMKRIRREFGLYSSSIVREEYRTESPMGMDADA